MRILSYILFLALPFAAAAPIDIKSVGYPNGMRSAEISPDGKHIAAIVVDGGQNVAVLINTDTLESKPFFNRKQVNANGDSWRHERNPLSLQWAGNELLAVNYYGGSESIDLTGKTVADLGGVVHDRRLWLSPDSPEVVVETDWLNSRFAIVDARTGERRKLDRPEGELVQMAFDKSKVLRAVAIVRSEFWSEKAVVENWYRANAGAPWEKLAEASVGSNYWWPIAVSDETGELYVSSDDYVLHRRLRTFNIKERTFGADLSEAQTAAVLDRTQVGGQGLLIRNGLKPNMKWFHPRWADLQATIDARLPGAMNRLTGNSNGKVLVHSYSDVDPGTWYLVDVAKRTMTQFGKAWSQIKPSEMRPSIVFDFPARDGLRIPAYLTLPHGAEGPQPMIVMPPSSATERDYWSWDLDVQVYSSNGYAVFRPQPRGTKGFSDKLKEAGRHQLGLGKQDDIADGVAYMIKEGIADPKRICIVGENFGGYAALMGLAKDPQLYRCGISINGPVDLNLAFRDQPRMRKADREQRQYLIDQLAPPKEQYDEISPLRHAAKITAPTLLLYGAHDSPFGVGPGPSMHMAMKKAGRPVEWRPFKSEGGKDPVMHALRRHYYVQALQFLDQQIGDGSKTLVKP